MVTGEMGSSDFSWVWRAVDGWGAPGTFLDSKFYLGERQCNPWRVLQRGGVYSNQI